MALNSLGYYNLFFNLGSKEQRRKIVLRQAGNLRILNSYDLL